MNILNLNYYQERFLKIIDKQGQLKSFTPNIYQKQLNKIIEEKRRHLEPIRIRILKPRQIGLSTWGSSLVYHFAATNFYKYAMIIAHDLDTSSGLFEKSKMFWEYSPEKIRPMRKRSNAKELVFDNPDETSDIEGLRSSIRIETANKLSAGRSKTIQCLHLSEKAFWKNAGVVQTGLFQSIPYSPGTIILDESTANGVTGDGEQFYNDYNDSNFTNVFFKWTDNKEYEIPVVGEFVLTDYEKELMSIYPELTIDKLNFRRFKISEMGSSAGGKKSGMLDPVDQFRQEYPFTENEAFISSGRPVFDLQKIIKTINKVKDIKFKQGEI